MLFDSNMLLVVLESTDVKVLCLSVRVMKCAAEHIVCVLNYYGVRRILCITLSCYFPCTCYFYKPFSVDINSTGLMTVGTEDLIFCGCQLNYLHKTAANPMLTNGQVDSSSFTNNLCHG
jgi:hypothetical protein